MGLNWRPCDEPADAWVAKTPEGEYVVRIRQVTTVDDGAAGLDDVWHTEWGWDFFVEQADGTWLREDGDDYSRSMAEAVRRAEWHASGQDLDLYEDMQEIHGS